MPDPVRTIRQGAEGLAITPNFRVGEWTCPAMYGLPAAPYPDEWIEPRLRPLCEQLEVLRAALGGYRVILRRGGGYRTAEWNQRHIEAGHNAAPNSWHIEGLAADIVVEGNLAGRVQVVALKLYQAGKLKIGGLGRYPDFTHVDIRPRDSLVIWDG